MTSPPLNVVDHVERGARHHPDNPALRFEDRSLSYRELEAMTIRASGALAGVGVARGDRVALMLPNVPAWVVAYVAILRLGAIAVTVNPGLTEQELDHAIGDSGARVLVTTAERAATVRRDRLNAVLTTGGAPTGCVMWEAALDSAVAAPEVERMSRDDPAVIVFSSGTEGVPKGVTLSHGNVASNMDAKVRHLGIRPTDRLVLFVPLFHCYGQNAILNAGLNAG